MPCTTKTKPDCYSKPKCMICGRPIAKTIKLPAGKVHLCSENECKTTFNFLINNSTPIVWAGMDDIKNHETVHPDIIAYYEKNNDVCQAIARDVEDYVWSGGTMGDIFHDALVEAGQKLEKWYVEAIPKTQLPLAISLLKSEEAKQALEKRLKS